MTEHHRRSSRVLGSLLFTAALPLIATASLGCRQGDRAAAAACPAGEICSPSTPQGLTFHGSPFSTGSILSDFFLAPTALGGTQHIRWSAIGEEVRLPSVEALSTDDGVLGVSDRETSAAWVRGESEGTATLRIVETADGSLLDRVPLDVRPIDRVALVWAADLVSDLAPFAPDVVFVPGHHTIAVRLVDREGHWLVDESLVVSDAERTYPRARDGGWDARDVVVGSEDLPLTIRAGDRAFELALRAAGEIDGIQLATWLYEEGEDGALLTTASSLVCATRTSGGAWVMGEPDRAMTLRVDGREIESFPWGAWTCGALGDQPLGAVRIEAQLGELHASDEVTVVAEAPVVGEALISAPKHELRSVPRVALGERAALPRAR